ELVEVVPERLLAQVLVDELEHVTRAGSERVIFEDQAALGELRVTGLAGRVPGEPDQPVGMRQRLHTGVDGRALGRVVEKAGVLEGIVAVLALERVHHPGDVAHAADHLGVGEQPHQCRQLGGPGAVGVEDHRLREGGVIGVEQAAQNARALRLVDHGGELGAGGDLCDDVVEQGGDWARHAGVEARVLSQDRGGERRAGARQAGDEMEGAARWQGGHRRLRHARPAAWRVQPSKPQALRRLRAYRPARRVVKGKPSTLQGSRRAFNADFIRTLADEFRLFCDGYAFLEGLWHRRAYGKPVCGGHLKTQQLQGPNYV